MMLLPWLLLTPLAGLLATLLAMSRSTWQAWIILVMSLLSLGASLGLCMGGETVTIAAGGWPVPLGIALRADMLSRIMLVLTGTIFSVAAVYHLGQSLRGAAPTRNPVYPLSFPLLLLALNGIFITGDFFNFYVFFELVAVSSYLLVSLGKHAPLEAAWKYSAQSVLGSICLLIGVVSLYGKTGALEMIEVSSRLGEPAYWSAPFFLVAFLLKGAIFPFHFWQPDAHAAATTTGSVLLAGLLIKVGIYGLLRFWPLLMGGELLDLFLVLGAASILFGAVAAWSQPDAKRMLGFSSISQLGFVLLGLGWGTVGALAAAILYLISHSLAKALLFMATGALADRVGSTRFAELAGTGRGTPVLSAAYLIGGMSLVGLPPTLGFFAKIGLLGEGVAAQEWSWVALAGIGSLMTAGYVLKAFQRLFWEEGGKLAERPSPLMLTAVILGMTLVLLGFFVGEGLWGICLSAATELWPPAFGPGEIRPTEIQP
jgi:multicomponent Na+:H+ antiporter subunit D